MQKRNTFFQLYQSKIEMPTNAFISRFVQGPRFPSNKVVMKMQYKWGLEYVAKQDFK